MRNYVLIKITSQSKVRREEHRQGKQMMSTWNKPGVLLRIKIDFRMNQKTIMAFKQIYSHFSYIDGKTP